MNNSNKNELPPGILCLKDIRKITGRSHRTALRISKKIKQKTGFGYITVQAFCDHTGFDLETISMLLQSKK